MQSEGQVKNIGPNRVPATNVIYFGWQLKQKRKSAQKEKSRDLQKWEVKAKLASRRKKWKWVNATEQCSAKSRNVVGKTGS
jgi:hypothetical protein